MAAKKSGNKGGRPEKYTAAYLEKLAKDLLVWCDDAANFFLGKFAQTHGFHRRRLPEFAKKNKAFAAAYEVAKQHQENVLVEGALLGGFDRIITIFTLKNVAGWVDKTETENKHKVAGNVTVKVVSYADPKGPKPGKK